jgi:hypothetical protein
MNIHLIWALACAGCLLAGTWYGTGLGEDKEYAKRAREDSLVQKVGEAAQNGAANAIAANRPRNITIKQETEREIQTNTVYADCRATPNGVRLVNEALTGVRPDAAGDSKLPSADPAKR